MSAISDGTSSSPAVRRRTLWLCTYPVPMTEPSQRTAASIADVASARALGWRVAAELLQEPDDSQVTRLRDGSLVADLRDSLAWLGDDSGRFLDVVMTLETVVRRSARRSHREDLEALRAEHARLFPDGRVEPVDLLHEQAGLVDEEAVAWGAGDHERAKALRLEQNQRLEATMVDTVPDWCVALDQRARLMLFKVAARLLTSYLAVESGRDFDRAVVFDGDLATSEANVWGSS